MKQIFNPFLPLSEYIPDGEPHQFGDRVYIYGSHDREGGYTFCMDDYVTYSAPVDDLKNWRYEGVIFKASQDPDYEKKKYMYAPDVVQGNDGKYYLYYCMSGDYGVGGYTGTIHVAVCDSPCGEFQYLGEVKHKDGTPMREYVCFDPAVMNDHGVIRLFYGTQYRFEEMDDFSEDSDYVKSEMEMFGRTKEEILSYLHKPESSMDGKEGAKDSIMGPVGCVLEDDMLTIREAPHHIIPYAVKGTSFEEHPFFEASSMRKVGDKYYFVYSSMQNHELCYAMSEYWDHGFTFGGTIVSNGDIGYEGRSEKDKHNMTGTTHGSIICLNEEWYVFYHRLTHKSDYSRQACAQKIVIEKDGSIKQVEITSCGLNGGSLCGDAGETYEAPIACIITNGRMPHGCNSIYKESFPNVNHKDGERFIAEICDGTLIGYKYFDFHGIQKISITVRVESEKNKVIYEGPTRADERCTSLEEIEPKCGEKEHYFEVRLKENGEAVGKIEISYEEDFTSFSGEVEIPDGEHGLFFLYHGREKVQLKNFTLG